MALLKAIESSFGVNATYWNIYSITENYKVQTIDVVLVGYASQETRLANFDPISNINYQFKDANYITDATRAVIYNLLKTTDFSDATDV